MEISILGPISIVDDGVHREIKASKVRALLATLALEPGRAVARVELAEELWAGQPMRNTHNALQVTATRVRKILDTAGGSSVGALLRAVPKGYLLDLPAKWIDSNRFLDIAAQGTAELAKNPLHAAELLEESLQLWRGPALLDAGDGMRCRGAAALLDERRLVAWEDLITARIAMGQERETVPELQQLTARYPLRERFCELLMLALYRTGRQSEALEAYAITRRHLDEQLGVRPGDGLLRRQAQILEQAPDLNGLSVVWTERELFATRSATAGSRAYR